MCARQGIHTGISRHIEPPRLYAKKQKNSMVSLFDEQISCCSLATNSQQASPGRGTIILVVAHLAGYCFNICHTLQASPSPSPFTLAVHASSSFILSLLTFVLLSCSLSGLCSQLPSCLVVYFKSAFYYVIIVIYLALCCGPHPHPHPRFLDLLLSCSWSLRWLALYWLFVTSPLNGCS